MPPSLRSLQSGGVEPAESTSLQPKCEAPAPLLTLGAPDLARIVAFCCVSQRTDLTLMFADLVPTGRRDSGGEQPKTTSERSARLCDEYISEVGKSIERDGAGCLVAQLGNSVLAVFLEARIAVERAQEIQREIARENERRPIPERLSVKIGLAADSSGSANPPDGSLIHRMAHDAGMIADAAPTGQILLNAAVYERARGIVYAGNIRAVGAHCPRLLPAVAVGARSRLWQVAPERRPRLLASGARPAASWYVSSRRILAAMGSALAPGPALSEGVRRIVTSPILLVLVAAAVLIGWAGISPKLRDGALSLAVYARAAAGLSTKPTARRGTGLHPAGRGLVGANLRGKDLRGRDFRGARMARANLSNANLIWADLRGADLSSASLVRASLFQADLGGANLRGADLRRARDILFADLRDARYDRGTRWPRGFSPDAHGARRAQLRSSRRARRPG